ncbi:hypothetical protein H6G54_03830 [Anabaena cylindrica FACHB-243]|uniref:hypothetical protein n=1 Tax=Anabaena TaxID=1163 RepID=UPI00031CC9C1|nr:MULTISPECIES: hypothetical protein [Anabaena]MBD2416856.1 hypothetical protein [Anabaena cylindrica FACHB-243]MBY5280331.1 hypothetical protein [Anabaena sp. CCAP 1446/1C]MBY5308316.1 hypothetical protein [Anabaena sp. CCAP 1446/1C]MCM2405202.1 hypothetical protein [Anabaena sp. CCAP 1446/1C]
MVVINHTAEFGSSKIKQAVSQTFNPDSVFHNIVSIQHITVNNRRKLDESVTMGALIQAYGL